MKAFEEKYTAWMDGRLHGVDLEDFERELARTEGGLAEAKRERVLHGKLGACLRVQAQGPLLEFPEVFNQQVLDRIARESRPARVGGWRLPWLVWSGAVCLAVAAGLFFWMIPGREPGSPYWVEVQSVRVADPSLWAEPVCPPGEEVTLIWIDGLDYLPESYALR